MAVALLRFALIGLALGLCGCLKPNSTTCGEYVCPTGFVCTPDGLRCVSRQQLVACEGRTDGDACGDDGQCASGVCVTIVCGDGVTMRGEACDDGNRMACDGCSADCRTVEGCGNGVAECDEQCDDGTSNSNAPNATCRTDCRLQRCGDGTVDDLSGEDCDGAPPAGQDCSSRGYYAGTLGCSSACRADVSSCSGTCGDGERNGAELCDGLGPSGQSCQDFGYDVGNLYCNQLCTPSFRTCQRLGFVPMAYEGSGFFLYAAWGSSSTDVFTAGYNGQVLHYDGREWTEGSTGAAATVYGLGGTAPNDVWAVGVRGAIAHYDGTRWATQSSGTSDQLNCVWASSAIDVYVGGRGGALLHSTGNGTWTRVPIALASDRVLALWGSGPNDVYLTGIGEIWHFNGTAWSAQTLPPAVAMAAPYLYSIWGSGPTDVWAVGEGGTILHSDGTAWRSVSSGTTLFLNAVDGTSPSNVWAIGEAGLVLRWDGLAWQSVPSGTTSELFGLKVSQDRVIVTSPGTLLEFGLGVPTISQFQLPTTEGLFGVWASARNDVFAIAGTSVFHFDGTQWTDLVTNSLDELWAVWGSGPNDVFAVGEVGAIYRYDGMGWTKQDSGTMANLTSVWGSGPTDVYAVGGEGSLLHYDGTAWTALPTGTFDRFFSVWGSGATDVFAVAEKGRILHWNGSGWSTLDTGGVTADFWGVWGSGPNDVYFFADLNGIYSWNGTRFGRLGLSSRRSFNYGTGTSAHFGFALEYQGQGLFHTDGVDWTQFRLPAITTLSAWATREGTWVGALNGKGLFLDRNCADRESSCDDRWDNDCDDKLNCEDSDCMGSSVCSSGGLCQSLVSLSCGTSMSGSTAAGTPRLQQYACASRLETGRERAYRFVAATTGTVSLTLTAAPDFDVVVLSSLASGACDVFGGCVAATQAGSAMNRTVTFQATAGATYWVMVDAANAAFGEYQLEVSCP